MYALADRELTVSVPPRDYGLAAQLLADAAAADQGGETRRALEGSAHRLGSEIGREAGAAELTDILRHRGYEPYSDDDDPSTLLLRNCPFHAVATRHPEVVCAMNLALFEGMAEELPGDVEPRLDPRPGRCCVTLRVKD